MDGDAVRVSDAERERVAQRLARAQGQGRLEVAEFDERVRRAYGARTRGELAPLTADLPDEPAAPTRSGEPAGAAAATGAGRRPSRHLAAAVAVWATVSALNLGIWAVVALAASGPVHPWWVWVAGPWGLALALGAAVERAGLPLPPRPPRFGLLPVTGCRGPAR